MGLTLAVGVEDPQVYCPARCAIVFGNHVHPCLPGSGDAGWHWLDDAQGNVLVQLRLDLVTPVDWNGGSSVYWLRSRVRVDMDLDWFSLHHR